METYDKKDVIKSDFYTYFNANTMNAGIEVKPMDVKDENKSKPTTFLFDNENRCFDDALNEKIQKPDLFQQSLPIQQWLATGQKPERSQY